MNYGCATRPPSRCWMLDAGCWIHPSTQHKKPADHADDADIFFDVDCGSLLNRRDRATCTSEFLTQRCGGAETQRVCLAAASSGEVLAVNNGQEPLGQASATEASIRRSGLTQRPTLSERRPRLLLSSKTKWERTVPRHKTERGRRNRHAIGVAAGGVTVRDKRSRLERTGASPVAGDREIAGVSAGHSRRCRSNSAMNPLRLCAFAPLRFLPLCFPSVHLCLCGFLVLGGRADRVSSNEHRVSSGWAGGWP